MASPKNIGGRTPKGKASSPSPHGGSEIATHAVGGTIPSAPKPGKPSGGTAPGIYGGGKKA